MTIRLLLVDDHPIVREGLRAVLAAEPDFEVVGECGSGDDAVRSATELHPDLVLMDLRMPGLDGASATKRILATVPGIRVLVLTTYDDDRHILAAIEAGAAGYLLKDTPRHVLTEAVRDAAAGRTVLAPPVAARLVTRVRHPTEPTLTPREIDVLRRVALGRSNKQVAKELFIGETTVKTHLLRAYAKLGVDDRTAAVTTAIARGILPSPRDDPAGPEG
jgi:DNA-binding NarL/FixJ family response regulator